MSENVFIRFGLKIRVRTCAMWNMNFSNTYMMTTSMSLLNLSTCPMEMTSYNSKIAFFEIGSKNCTINICNMSDWFLLNGGLEISTYFPIYYQWTILSEFCFKIQFSTLWKYTPATSSDLNFFCKWFNIVWNCLIQKISGFEQIQNHPFFLYGRGHEISYVASIAMGHSNVAMFVRTWPLDWLQIKKNDY